MTESELNAAKAALRTRVLRGLEKPEDRLSESLRNLKTYGKIVHTDYLQWIDQVTASDVEDCVASIIGQTPTVVAQGGQISRLNLNF